MTQEQFIQLKRMTSRTYQEFADKCGYSVSLFYKYATGFKPISEKAETIIRLKFKKQCKELGI